MKARSKKVDCGKEQGSWEMMAGERVGRGRVRAARPQGMWVRKAGAEKMDEERSWDYGR